MFAQSKGLGRPAQKEGRGARRGAGEGVEGWGEFSGWGVLPILLLTLLKSPLDGWVDASTCGRVG